jgi:tripartite ATP-independent transporter DctM subunit|tara:strand:- start:1774 stop:3090 length:1317 start_codon:yes stop_codon:yes gene_type:complete
MGSEIILILLALQFALILLGFHIGIVLGLISGLGVYLIIGNAEAALSIISSTAYDAVRNQIFAVIPLFVLMGDIVAKSGAATDLYRLCDRGLSRLPGRLSVATVAGNAVFAAVTGVSVASAATFSRIAYPEMRKYGYDRRFALGSIAGSACLGMLIPPSILLIVWAILTELSVGALFVAGVVPGLVLTFVFAAYNVIKASRNPELAPRIVVDPKNMATPQQLHSERLGGLGIMALIVLVIGGIWGGLFTPSEAAGVGVIGALALGLAKGMRGKELMQAIYDAGKTTAPILFLLITASMYSRLLAFGGIVNIIQDFFDGLGVSPAMLVLIIAIIWLLLGMIIDSVSIILLTVPIFAPMVVATGFDPIAFAIFGILVIEAGLLTPPFGLLVYTVKGSVPDPDVTLGDIFIGSTPYLIMILFVAFLIWLFPALATGLLVFM